MTPILAISALVSCTAIDGDSLRCGEERVRLLAIDAPELPGHCRQGRVCAPGDPEASKAALARLVEQPVRIERVGRDRYGRTLAMVWAGNVNLSCAQVSGGHAAYLAKWDDGLLVASACSHVALRQ